MGLLAISYNVRTVRSHANRSVMVGAISKLTSDALCTEMSLFYPVSYKLLTAHSTRTNVSSPVAGWPTTIRNDGVISLKDLFH